MVGGLNPSAKYEFVSWDDDIHNICMVSQCQALASWLFWLLGTYSIFADYALTGECHPATW